MTNNARYNGKASFDEWKKEWAMEERYNFHTIEEKWQKIWEDEKAYKVEIDKNKKKVLRPGRISLSVGCRSACRTSAFIYGFGRYCPQKENAGF